MGMSACTVFPKWGSCLEESLMHSSRMQIMGLCPYSLKSSTHFHIFFWSEQGLHGSFLLMAGFHLFPFCTVCWLSPPSPSSSSGWDIRRAVCGPGQLLIHACSRRNWGFKGKKCVCVEWGLFFLIPKMSGRMKFGKEIPAQATGHLNSQKGNGWRAQNSVWESIRWGKCTIAVLRPDVFEKLKLTISSAIIFCRVMWNLMLRLANRKRHKGPCTAGIFCYSSVLRMRFFPLSSKGGFLPGGPTLCSAPWPRSLLENSVRQDWDKWSQKEDRFSERA